MHTHITVTPAKGRDYTSAAAAEAAWRAGEDFVLRNPLSPWDGRAINAAGSAAVEVTIRYARQRRTVVVTLEGTPG